MRTLPMIDSQPSWAYHADRSEGSSFDESAQQREECTVDEFPSLVNWEARLDDTGPHWRRGEFFRNLSTKR